MPPLFSYDILPFCREIGQAQDLPLHLAILVVAQKQFRRDEVPSPKGLGNPTPTSECRDSYLDLL